MPKQLYKCKFCGSDVLRYKSTVRSENRVFCNKHCLSLYQKLIMCGVGNPNYKDGKRCEIQKCNCGRKKDFRSNMCAVCSKKSFIVGSRKHTGGNHKNVILRKNREERVSQKQIQKVVDISYSYNEVSKHLFIGREAVKRLIVLYKIDISHFHPCGDRPLKAEDLLVNGCMYRNTAVKNLLIKNNILEYVCELCGQKNEWNGKLLVLQLDHKNGKPTDNRLENLRFLCPNCHTQTDTYNGRNIGVKNAKK